MSQIFWGVGVRRSHNDVTLDVLFPFIQSCDAASFATIKEIASLGDAKIESKTLTADVLEQLVEATDQNITLATLLENFEWDDNIYAKTDRVITVLHDFDTAEVETTEDAYLRLQMLSQRFVQPHGVSLANIFGKLPNNAWTNYGPILSDDLDEVRIQTIGSIQPLTVSHIDKFPYMVNYHIPSGVRIANGAKVRLGAYLGEGTTVMQAGFVNVGLV